MIHVGSKSFRFAAISLSIHAGLSPVFAMSQFRSQPERTTPNHQTPTQHSTPNPDLEIRTIELGQFIKWMNLADTGGQAKYLIQSGMGEVNGEVETRRRRKLVAGDLVCLDDREFVVEFDTF